MAKKLERKAGQVWRCNRRPKGYVWGIHQKAGVSYKLISKGSGYDCDQWIIRPVEVNNKGKIVFAGPDFGISTNSLTTRNNLWSFLGDEKSLKTPGPFLVRCAKCNRADVLTAILPPVAPKSCQWCTI